MDAPPSPVSLPSGALPARRIALRVLALLAAVLLLLAGFAAYRQPGFVLDFANLLLC